MDPSDARKKWISSLTEQLPLNGIDLNAPKVYTRMAYGFPFESNTANNINAAAKYLFTCFQRALTCFPFMGGQIIHPRDDKLPQLFFSRHPANLNIHHFCSEIFDTKVHGENENYHWTWNQLQNAGVPPDAIDKDLLSLSPDHPENLSGKCYHPVTLRLNFIPGGLVLCFAFHHAIADGASYHAFYQCMFNPGRRFDEAAFNASLRRRSNFNALLAGRGAQIVDITNLPEYDFDFSAPSVEAPVTSVSEGVSNVPACVASVLRFSAARVLDLKKEACEYLRSIYGPLAFVSSADTICGLTWLHVTRARLEHLDPNEITRFATAVDIRNRMIPDLTKEAYIGNMYLRTMTDKHIRVKDLVNTEDGSTPATLGDVAEAAWLIRRAIQAFHNPDHLCEHLALLSNVFHGADPDLISHASHLALNKQRTGLDNSVWVSTGVDIEFGIPGTGGGKPEWARKTYSAYEGSLNIMPRKGGTKGDEDWEILLALREDVMNKLMGETELGAYTTKPSAERPIAPRL
ncbi:hypothetical protein QBC34DRAFT_383152 [Podospora aff. communis PSN243]|uniref:Trichothecene 3-O-acetyltransferase n=1 Tax=Podospora aff. communis PSN243 TaxID=3040156 RepID=A0AAV9GHN6_9PEZI|nr:hypothetical protein QBC34DRAFT_383152 [Podospora aff. communis PSN243]